MGDGLQLAFDDTVGWVEKVREVNRHTRVLLAGATRGLEWFYLRITDANFGRNG